MLLEISYDYQEIWNYIYTYVNKCTNNKTKLHDVKLAVQHCLKLGFEKVA